jgi:AraC-like DNA-binding protein
MPSSRVTHSLPGVHALHLAELCRRWGVTAATLFEGTGLEETALGDPSARVPLATVEILVARARVLTGEPALGYYLGLQMRVSAHGYLGFAAMAASTVGAALELAARFAPTRTTALELRLETYADVASLVIEERAPLGSAQDVVILTLIVGIQKIGEAIASRALTGHAEVTFAAPAYVSRFAPLASQLRFGRPANRLVFPRAVLDVPLVMADAVASRLAREQCERELDALGLGAGVAGQVRALLPNGADGFRSLDEVAARMGVSARSLKRKLADQGAVFSDILDEERKGRALVLLASELPLETVAERVGYSDMANFARAFRRWTGATPAAFRRLSRARQDPA